MTLYDVLGVSQDASETEIRQQYQELARQYHPDKSAVEGAKEKFVQVTEAWHVLGDSQKRREYDDQLKREKVLCFIPLFQKSGICVCMYVLNMFVLHSTFYIYW